MPIVLVFLLVINAQAVSARKNGNFVPTQETIYVFPSEVKSNVFQNLETLTVQDENEGALFQSFNRNNSAYVSSVTPITTPELIFLQVDNQKIDTKASSDNTNINILLPVQQDVTGTTSSASSQSFQDVSLPDISSSVTTTVRKMRLEEEKLLPTTDVPVENIPVLIPVISEIPPFEVMPVETLPEDVPTIVPSPVQLIQPVIPTVTPPAVVQPATTEQSPATNVQASIETSGIFVSMFKKVTQAFSFAQSVVTTQTAEVVDQAQEIVNQNTQDSTSPATSNIEKSTSSSNVNIFSDVELGNISGNALNESIGSTSSSLMNQDFFQNSNSKQEDSLPRDVLVPENITLGLNNDSTILDTQAITSSPEITFSDFGLPRLESGQFIDNMQLRLSLAGQYQMNASSTIASIDVAYSFGEFSGESGSILMETEFSNAINGGYYIVPLPPITDSNLLKDLKITLTVNGEYSEIDALYIDAVWLEVGTVRYDKNLLEGRASLIEMLNKLEGPKKMEFLSNTLDFKRDEIPSFSLRYTSQRNVFTQFLRSVFSSNFAKVDKVKIVKSTGEEVNIQPAVSITPEGIVNIVLAQNDKEQMKPGTYVVEVDIDEGGVVTTDSFEFQWGLLSINSLQTEYTSGDTVDFNMGALTPAGNTLCNADLRLYIIDPLGFIDQTYVAQSGLCLGNNVIDVPDYSAVYSVTEVGEYQMYLEQIDVNGNVITHTSDTFFVAPSQEIVIARNGPTRIYPLAEYNNTLTVRTFGVPFSGEVIERVPKGFIISNTDAQVQEYNTYIELRWNIYVAASSSQVVGYTFDAPDISPYLYELGPARLVSDQMISVPPAMPITILQAVSSSTYLGTTTLGMLASTSSITSTKTQIITESVPQTLVQKKKGLVFKEHRKWQIASDAPENYNVYTIVDPSGYLTVASSTQINVTGANDADSYAYRDMGINWLVGDFYHDFDIFQSGSGSGKWYPWVVSGALGNARALKNTAGDGYSVELRFKNGGVECRINEYYGGANGKCGATFALNTWVYARVARVGTTLTLYIYSDKARTVLVTSSSVVVAGETPRYVYGVNNENRGRPARTYAGSVANLELYSFTQSSYRFFTNTDSTSVGAPLATQNTPVTLTSTGQTFRLRTLLHATGSPVIVNAENFNLQYAPKIGACDVGFVGEVYTDVTATSTIAYNNNITPVDGALLTTSVNDPTHGADTIITQNYEENNSFTNTVTKILPTQDGLWDFALKDNGANASSSFCFRTTFANGDVFKVYTSIPEITTYTPPPVVNVSTLGVQVSTLGFPTNTNDVGARFVLTELSASSTITDITITEKGTVDAQNNITNIKLYYDYDTSAPYDCASETYIGTEPQFGVTDTNGFSSSNGTSTFSGTSTITTTQSMCVYTVFDILPGTTNGATLDFEVSLPTTDVLLGSGTAGPSNSVQLTGITNIRNDYLQQMHYHFRNDDGSEAGATSATGGVEDTPLASLSLSSSTRIRLTLSNEGSSITNPSTFGLEYATATSGPWTIIPTTPGSDWIMKDSLNLISGANTTNIPVSTGGVNDENVSFLVSNGGIVDTTVYTGSNTISPTQFIEMEFSVQATTNAISGGTYFFRATSTGSAVETYNVYPSLTLLSPDLQQMHYHFRNDDGSEAGATSATGGVEDTPLTNLAAGDVTRVRFGISNQGVENAQNVQFQLEFASATTGPWTAVPSTIGQAWIMEDSANLTDGSNSTNIATTTGGVTDENVTFIVNNNGVKDTSSLVSSMSVSTTEFTELEFSIRATQNAASSTYYFRVTNAGTPLNTYLVYPQADLIFGLTQAHYRWRNDDGGEAGASAGDGHVMYGDDGVTTNLYTRTMSGVSVGAETTFALGGANVAWPDIEASPVNSNRLLRGVMDTAGPAVQTAIYNNATAIWTPLTTVTANTGNARTRLFDIEFEQSTGDAIIVYGDGTAGALRYRTMAANASVWSAEQTLLFAGGGALNSVRAVRDPSTDDIMIGWEDSAFDVFSVLWNGATFGVITTHELNSINQPGAADSQVFDIAWEGGTSTSEALISWMDNLGVTKYNTWTGGVWGTSGIVPGLSFSPSGGGGVVIASTRWSAEHPKIAIISGSSFDRKLRVNIWSGSVWGSSVLLSAVGAEIRVGRALPVEAVWQTTSGNLFVPYITRKVESGVRLKIYNTSTNAWTTNSVGPLGVTGFFQGYVRADADSNSQAVSIVSGDRKTAIGTFTYICGAPCNTGAVSEWTEHEVDIDAARDRTVLGDIVYFESTSATFRENEDTETVALQGEKLRLRFEVNNKGTTTIASSYRLEVSQSNPTTCAAGTYTRVNTDTGWNMTTSSYISDGESTFNINPGLTDEDVTFVTGALKETSDQAVSVSLSAPQFTELEYIIKSTASSTVGATYCFRVTNAGTPTNFLYAENTYGKVTLETSFTENTYRWYVNENANTPTDVWPVGVTNLAENTTISALYAPKPADVLRLRTTLQISNSTLPAGAASFKLQYAEGATCLASLPWQDVGAIGSSTALWRGYNNTSISDGATLSSTTLSVSNTAETYEEENNSTSNPNAILPGEDGEYDWVLENNNAPSNTSYCFRMITDANRAFQNYTHYPSLVTNGTPDTPTLMSPFSNRKTSSTTPPFDFIASDAAGDDIHYQIQIDNNFNFSSPLIDKDSITNFLQFENTTLPSDKAPFDSGKNIRFTPQAALTNGTTYWWRVRAKDPSGSNEWSSWATPWSVTVDNTVTITTWFQTTEEQLDTGTFVNTLTPVANNVQLSGVQTTGTTTSTAIDFDWRETGNAWGSLIWNDTETVGDIKHHVEYFASTSVWETVPETALPGNTVGFDVSPISILALDSDIYNQIRVRSNFTNIGGTPILNSWTVEWGLRVNQPTQTKLFDNEQTGTTTPSFEFYTTDPQNDDLQYQISWSTTTNFIASTTKVSGVDLGYTDLTNGADLSPFASGDTLRYTVQAIDVLSASTTYWWRVRARDPLGSNVYSRWSTLYSYTVDQSTAVSTWFQTTASQFDTNTLTGVYAESATDDARVQQAIGEYGKVTVTGNAWTTVTTNNSYNNLVVVASPRYQPNANTERSTRIKNKTSNSFDIKVDNIGGALAGITVVDWIAVESGSWTIQDGSGGTKIEAGTKNVTQVQCSKFVKVGGEKVTFNTTFIGPPAVLHNVSSNVDTTWVASHINGGGATSKDVPTETQMGLALNRSNENCTHGPEDIDYLAVDQSHGTNNGGDFDSNVGGTVRCCNATGYANIFTSPFVAAPAVTVVSQMGEQDGRGGYIVTHTGTPPSATTYYSSVDESAGGNRAHNKDEAVALIAFASASGTIVRNTLTGTMDSTSVNFDAGAGPFWDKVSWIDTEIGASTLLYQVLYLTSTSSWAVVPNTDLPGNSSGTTVSPIDISGLSHFTYNNLKLRASFTCTLAGDCPVLQDWKVEWAAGVQISGIARGYNQIASTTSGTVVVAVNGVIQTGKTGTIGANGAWSIADVTMFPGDIITVFVNGAIDADEAIGVTQYDGLGNLTGMELYKRHLTLGSDVATTTAISNADIAYYDFTNDEDLFFDINGSNSLDMCATTGCGDAGLIILNNTTYQPGSVANVSTHDFENNGTFKPAGNTIRINGSWDNNATTTMATSSIIFTSTSTVETVDSTGAISSAFHNVTFGETSGTATWNLVSAFDANNNLSVTYGTLARGSQTINIGGVLVNGTNASWSGIGTTTFDGSGSSNWSDQNPTLQNVGRVVIDGTSKAILLAGNVAAESITIGANDTLDVSTSNYNITVYSDWTNDNTFNARAATVFFAATSTGKVINGGGNAFYNITFNGAGGGWSFSTSTQVITKNFTVATGTVTMTTGTTTIGGSFSAVGGTFLHNNATIVFNATGPETITASGTAFTNAFYNLNFNGSGSWTFIDVNATTSNDIFIPQGSVTFPSGTLTIGGTVQDTGGSFNANNGTLKLISTASEILQAGGSLFYNLTANGTGAWSFIDPNVTIAGDLTIATMAVVTAPSATLSLGGSFANTGSFVHNNGTVLFNGSTIGHTIDTGVSSLYDVTFNGPSGGWTISTPATSTNNFTLTNAHDFTLASGKVLSVGGTFTNSVGGASTTWNGSTVALVAGAYSLNAKTDRGDQYSTLLVSANTDIKMWNSSSTVYSINGTGSLYSEDHSGIDGSLYIYGNYPRLSGTEYWSYATDFDGTNLGTTSARQVNVKFASGASASLTNAILDVVGSNSASTTIGNQGSGTYTISITSGTTTVQYYDFKDLGSSGLSLLASTTVISLSDGSFTPAVAAGTAITVSSTTIDSNPTLQIYRVNFSTTTAISANNVTQSDGTPTSYWWFRQSSGNLGGEAFDNDTGDPGSIRWDDSSLVITVSGTVYADQGVIPLTGGTCDGISTPVRIVVENGSIYDGSCSAVDGSYSISGVIIIGDPTVTTFLNGASGGEKAVTVTKTPTANVTGLDLYTNRVITRHEDTAPMTIVDMTAYDNNDDTDIFYTAATGTIDTLLVQADKALYVWATSTFTPGGAVTMQSGGTGTVYDGSLTIATNATFTGAGTTTYSIGGILTLGSAATFVPASSTVLMTATTSGKAITSTNGDTVTFNELQFTGPGGSWNINGNVSATANIVVATGTVTGTGDISLSKGSFSGNGLLSLGGGTTTIQKSNILGGTQPWTFSNLVLGDALTVGTTTPYSNATTTVGGILTLSTAHFLNAGGSHWNLSGTGVVLVEDGTFLEGTSTVQYSGTGATDILSTNYYNLSLNAGGGAPTYTATGLGIQVFNILNIGATGSTTVDFTSNDPALNVDGDLTIGLLGTFIASNIASSTIAGSYDNNGIFTSSGGTVTFDGSGAHTIAAGNSDFSTVTINTTGDFNVIENATATASWNITAANNFTVNTGKTLAVGGVFTNTLAGAGTTWSGSTLYLYGGGTYEINASTTNDRYDTLLVASGTNIRMWNSVATTTTISGSLYSQDHNQIDGDLYIFGAYNKSVGIDYWEYGKDFDGTDLTGGLERKVDVFIQNTGSVQYGGSAELSIRGTTTSSTTIQNQGVGTYGFIVGGNASTTMNYYDFINLNNKGVTFTATPNVVDLSYGRYLVEANGYTAITVGSTVIDQNPAKTFTKNIFATSTGVTSATNVTATGTSVSSWRFTNHSGDIDGELFDIDPDGDPGYIVWDDSAANITISGKVYSDEGTTVSAVCDGITNNVHIRIAGLTSYITSCNAITGLYSIGGIIFSSGDSVVTYIDNEIPKGAVVTVDLQSNINNMDIYENRVIVRNEGINPLTIANMSVWDSSNDIDIPFTALTGAPDTLVLPTNKKLIIWNNKLFSPGGNVTVTGGGGGATYDGSLELYAGSSFTSVGNQVHTIGGSLLSGTGAIFTAANSTTTFTTTGASRTIDINAVDFYNVEFTGGGSWNITDATFTAHNVAMTAGTVTLPNSTTTISGSFNNSAGAFVHNGSPMVFTGAGSNNVIAFNGSDTGSLLFTGTGSWNMSDISATSSGAMTISSGTVTLPSGSLTLGDSFRNEGGTIIHNTSELIIATSTSATVLASSSDLYGLTFRNGGSFTMEDVNVTLLGSLTVASGSLTLATGTLSIAGSFDASGGTFGHSSGTILFNATTVGKTINPGASAFYNVNFGSASGGWSITANATATRNFTLTSANSFTQQTGTVLQVGNVFTNSVGGSATTWTGSELVLNSGSDYSINAKSDQGDEYEKLTIGNNTDIAIWNSKATTTSVANNASLYSKDHGAINGNLSIYGDYHIATTTEYWSYATDFDGTALGVSSRVVTVSLSNNATTTVDGGTLNIVGISGSETLVQSQSSGTYAFNINSGVLNAQYYTYRNLDTNGLSFSNAPSVLSLNNGDFELSVNGGRLINISSTTLDANASLVITGARFATTTAITGTNVYLTGSTPNAWTFIGHTGNLSGESFDIDGVGVCESIRWDDSSCLLTQQTQYRWRNDDGGVGAPNTQWMDLNWGKRKSIRIDNQDATTYSNAVVKVTVLYDADMQAGFGDIRFTDNSGTTSLSFFLASTTNSAVTEAWVKIPTLLSGGTETIYVYYNNAVATTTSSIASTFIAGDDYEDGNIIEYSGDTSLFTVDGTFAYGGIRGLDNTGFESSKATDGIARTDQTVSQDEIIRFSQYIDTGAGAGDEVCTLFGVQAPVTVNQNYAVCLEQFGTDRMALVKNAQNTDSSGILLSSTNITYSTGWYNIEIDWKTSNVIDVTLFKDGAIVATTSATDSTYTSGGYGFTYWFHNGGWDNFTSRIRVNTEPLVRFGVEQVSGGASWRNSQGTAGQYVPNETARLRLAVENSGLPITNQNFQLEYAVKSTAPSCESVSNANYTAVPNQASCGSSPICMQATSQYVNGVPTADLLDSVEGSAVYGQAIESPFDTTSNINVAQNHYTELEYALTPTLNASDPAYCLRVTNGGSVLDTYLSVAELTLRFDPILGSVSFNNGADISLLPGTTTRIYATSTVTDLNGYSDILVASSTMYTASSTASCTINNNDCYIETLVSNCSLTACAGNSCVLSCYADVYYYADPTDTNGGNFWYTFFEVEDTAGGTDFATSPGIDVLTLRALNVTNSIDYGALAPSTDTGVINASTTIENLGNDAIDVQIVGNDLSDGYSSIIPASEQKFATSTFNYATCVTCTALSTSSINYRVDLAKPTSTVPAVTDQIFWGIAIPFGAASNPHTGSNIFYAISNQP